MKFFRAARFRFLGNNKVVKYVLYIFGEVLLVVIGILVALNVNNWNEERKDRKNVHAILEDMQEDLLNDIRETSSAISWMNKSDSLIMKIVYDSLTIEDYRQAGQFSRIGMEAYPIVITNIAFLRLADYTNTLPPSYDNFLSNLYKLYVERTSYIEETFNRLNTYGISNYNALSREKPWFINLARGDMTPEIIDYFLNDSTYKSKTIRFWQMQYEHKSNVKLLQQEAVLLYYDIAKLLNKEQKIPQEVRDIYTPAMSKSELIQVCGNYELQSKEIRDVMTIKLVRNRLFINDHMATVPKKDSIVAYGGYTISAVFKRNSSNDIDSCILYSNSTPYTYIKK